MIRNDHGKQILTESHLEHAVDFFWGGFHSLEKKNSCKCELHQIPHFFGEMQRAYFPGVCASMELDLLDPDLLCAQFIICDFFIGFFHRCLLGAFCTSEIENMSSEHYIKNNIHGELREVLQ